MSDGLDKRNWFANQRVRAEVAAGLTPNLERIHQETAALLNYTDRAVSAGDVRQTKREATEEEKLRAKDQSTAKSLAAEQGAQFYMRENPVDDDAKKKPAPLTGVEMQRHIALIKRVTQLLAADPNHRLRFGRDGIHDRAYQYPVAARQIVDEMYAHTHGWRSPEFRRGGLEYRYADLSKADRTRMYYAALELICDRSNGVVGVNWWVR